MAERRPHRGRTSLAVGLLLAALLALVPAAGAAPSSGLTGWLAASRPPQRTLVLFPPAGTGAITSTVHVTENGQPVHGLSTSLVSAANPGDFGVIVAGQVGDGLPVATKTAVGKALGTIIVARQAAQQLGVIAFGARAQLVSPLNADTSAMLSQHNHQKVQLGGGTPDPSAAITLGVQTLKRSGVALGGIILLSDGSGASSGGAVAARAAAVAANVPVITVPIDDAASTMAGLRALEGLGVSHTSVVTPDQVSTATTLAYATLNRATVVRWRSAVTSGQVAVLARADGVPGTVHTTYTATGSAAAHHVVAPRWPSAAALRAAVAGAPKLATSPAFSTPATPAAPTVTAPPTAPPAATAAPPAAPSFWDSSEGMLAVAIVAGLLIGSAIFVLLHRPTGQGVRTRVGVFVAHGHVAGQDPSEEGTSLIARDEKTGWWADFVHTVEVSRNPRSATEIAQRAGLAGVLLAGLLYYVAGSPIAALLPLLGWPFVMRAVVRRSARKMCSKFRDSLPVYLQDLSSAMRVGRTFVGAIAVVAEGADEPTRSELERVVADEQFGMPLEEALEAAAKRMDAPDMEQVALIASLNRRSGSNVAEALDRVAEGARERADLHREVKALTAQAKMSSYVLTALPACVLGATNVMSPTYARPFFHSTIGFIVLGVATAMVFAGWKVMSKISRVKT